MPKIIFTGGGTGGHVFPIIAIVDSLRERANVDVLYIGPTDFTAKFFLKEAKIKTHYILSGKIRRYFSFKAILLNLRDIIFNIPIGLIQSFIIMFFAMPDLIVSKGGYGSIPVVLAGFVLRIPIFIHESDITPGMANRIASHFAEKIFTSFDVEATEYFPKKKMIKTGCPVRKSIIEGRKNILKLKGGKKVLLVLGGSQGSERINDVIVQLLPELLKDYEVIHQTGLKDIKRVEEETVATIDKELLEYYHPYFFLDSNEIADAYNLANVVIGRAGGGMISEVSALGKPSILVPLAESAQDHQTKNAYAYAKNGACVVLEEPNFTKGFILEELKMIDEEKMSQKAKEFSEVNASGKIAEEILKYLT